MGQEQLFRTFTLLLDIFRPRACIQFLISVRRIQVGIMYHLMLRALDLLKKGLRPLLPQNKATKLLLNSRPLHNRKPTSHSKASNCSKMASNFMADVTGALKDPLHIGKKSNKEGGDDEKQKKTEKTAKPAPPPPPPLSRCLLQKDWDEVRKILADSDRDKVAEMTQVWHEKDLPLHVACRKQAPDDIIFALIDLDPSTVRTRSHKDNRLPLVLCVKNKGSFSAVGKLIRAYPEALDLKIDDKSLVDLSTIRSDFSQWGVSGPVKKMLQRSTDDWKVVIEWEKEQVEYGQKVATLEEKVKSDEARIELGEKKDRALLKKIRDLENKHDEFAKSATAKIEALTEALQNFQQQQKLKNTELKNDLEMQMAREVVSRDAFRGYTDDLLSLYKRNASMSEDLQKQVADMKISQTIQNTGLE